MDRPSKFDRAIQDKLSGLEAEPSARVWAGVREGMGAQAAGTRAAYPWLRIAAAAALLIMAGAGTFYLLRQAQDPGQQTGHAFAQPAPRHWTLPALRPDSAPGILPMNAAEPRQNQGIALQSPPKPRGIQEPMPDRIPPFDAPQAPREEVVQDAPAPQPLPQPAPLEKRIPEALENPAPIEVQAIASTQPSTKRSFRMPTADDITIAKIRESSKGLLPTLAQKAEDRLGIPTEYTQKSTPEGELTAFSMDLGFIKFRRVRNSK